MKRILWSIGVALSLGACGDGRSCVQICEDVKPQLVRDLHVLSVNCLERQYLEAGWDCNACNP